MYSVQASPNMLVGAARCVHLRPLAATVQALSFGFLAELGRAADRSIASADAHTAVGGQSSSEGQGLHMLSCAHDPAWSFFRDRLLAAMSKGGLQLDQDLMDTAQAMVITLESQGGLIGGAEQFYQDLCSEASRSFCIYGAVNAIFVIAVGIHNSALHGDRTDADAQQAQAQSQGYLQTAVSLLGLQHCLDFMESSAWPFHANDILANLNRSRSEPFILARDAEVPAMQPPPPRSSLSIWTAAALSHSLASAISCPRAVRVVAIGTHPTLTMEAVGMLSDFGFERGQEVTLRRTLGITYKCAVFPEMCANQAGDIGNGDPVADLIGPFDAPPADDLYTFARITEALEDVSRELVHNVGMDVLVCTSPYIVCALLQKLSGVPLLGYLGLPLLWKRPTDHFSNSTAHSEFWKLMEHLIAQPHVVLATNNPVLSEQIAFQATGAILPVVRPHAIFTRAAYAPTHMEKAMLVSRTKFLWVTLGCALRHFMPAGYPVAFTVANSDSKLTFREMAAHRLVVILPWEHALMAFFEFYSMAVPLLMPSAAWAYRLVFDSEGNLGSTTSQYADVSPGCDIQQGCNSRNHPFPPFAFAPLDSRRYWYQYCSFAQFPHVHTFSNIPDLLEKVVTLDLQQTSALMKAFNDKTLVSSIAFWREAAAKLLTGRQGCGVGAA